MPKLACGCGYVLNLSIVPSPYGFAVIGEHDFQRLRERLEEAESLQTVWLDAVGQQGIVRQAYICPRCGRLHLFATASDDTAMAVWTLERGDVSELVPPEGADQP